MSHYVVCQMQYVKSTRMSYYSYFAVCTSAYFLAILTHNPLYNASYARGSEFTEELYVAQ